MHHVKKKNNPSSHLFWGPKIAKACGEHCGEWSSTTLIGNPTKLVFGGLLRLGKWSSSSLLPTPGLIGLHPWKFPSKFPPGGKTSKWWKWLERLPLAVESGIGIHELLNPRNMFFLWKTRQNPRTRIQTGKLRENATQLLPGTPATLLA